jgi:enoyl-CoA hydratase/carnithine racemase
MEMLLTGQPIDAATAERWGLVNRVVEPGRLMDEARELAERMIAAAPLAVRAVKATVLGTEELAVERGYEAMRDGSIPALARAQGSEDAKEGPRAFAEGRDPEWSGE